MDAMNVDVQGALDALDADRDLTDAQAWAVGGGLLFGASPWGHEAELMALDADCPRTGPSRWEEQLATYRLTCAALDALDAGALKVGRGFSEFEKADQLYGDADHTGYFDGSVWLNFCIFFLTQKITARTNIQPFKKSAIYWP